MESMNGKYTAKKANIFIELHNFSFRHNMFQSNADDFIGRKLIRNRLKAILYHTKAHSGTYLITGNRGVGKTSLVNKVLSELSPAKRMASGMIRFLTLLFCTLLSTAFMKIFNLYDYKLTILFSGIVIILSLAVYLFYYSSFRKKPAPSNYLSINFLWGILITLSELIILNQKTNRAGRSFQFAKIAIWTAVFQLVYISNTFNNNIPSDLLAPPSLCILLGCFLWIINWISNVHNILSKADKHENSYYRELISNSKATSYAMTTCIVTLFPAIITILIIFIIKKCTFSTYFEMLCIILFPILLFLFSLFNIKSTKKIYSMRILLKLCIQLLENAIGEHISIKNWINQPRQVFVKINLGYEELKSIDILRLISHNLTIEYRKYIYSGSFYWLRTFLVIIICLGCTLFFTRFVTYDFKIIFHKVTTNENFIAIISSTYNFLSNIYEQIYIGVSYVIAFIVRLFDNSNLYYNKLPISNYEKPIISFTQFLFFLLLIFIYKMTAYIPLLKHHIRAPFLNLRHLMQLQESIVADIKTEDNIKGENRIMDILKIGINKKIEKKYPMLDAHDIEKKLIDIMEDISEGWLFQHPQFIIIFDELDKIESEEIKKEKMSKTDSFSPDTIRLRQEAIFELLSGLKYILSTMPAKFIFVAGREMYEASLADASDRSHYLSSIFDDVINVPSFMSDFSDDKSFDICSMTEQYVCRLLFPAGHIVKEYSLKEYGKYLLEKDEEFISKEFYHRKTKEEENKKNELILERAYQREELLMHLNNFIMYLTYAGKGAPKKMISLFDKYVVKLQPYDLSEMEFKYQKGMTINPLLVRYYKNTIYYLKFDFYEQYTLGLMARMITPVVYRFSHRNIHQYGDKLLVSTLFFMDHLFKFHSHSFSWRSLASSPELIDVNKTPELRNHIADILHFLTQNDLKTISNGLYDFRFFKVIAQEISFMTRVSEISSATFDFSLDESLAVKQYYERRLANQRKAYESDHIKTENTIFELADQHFTLGELYLYDEDLDNAIVEFDAAISIIQTLKPINMTSETILALIKNMLSLGIAYEKQNLNDQAFLIYSEVVKLIIASRNTDIGKLGLKTYEGADHKMKVRKDLNQSSEKEPAIYFQNKVQNSTSLMELLDKIPHIHPDIHMVISKITVYDGLQLMYLPLLAKFQILEKSQIGGIQKEDIRRLLKEFYFLSNMITKNNKSLICASFYLKLGNILYYKNAHLMKNSSMLRKEIFPFEVCRECSVVKKVICEYNTNIYKTQCKFSSRDNFWGESIKTDALHFYIHCLFLIANETNYTACYNMKHFINKLSKLREEDFKGWDENRFNMFGKVLSCIGDVFMSELESTNTDNLSLKDFLKEYFKERNITEDKKENNNESNTKDNSTLATLNKLVNSNKNSPNTTNMGSTIEKKIVKIAILYILSALFYSKATAHNMTGYLNMKLLTLLKYNATSTCQMEDEGRIILKRAIRNISSSFKDICFEYQQDIDDILKETKSSKPDSEKITTETNTITYNKNSLLYVEAFESILAYHGIEVASIKAEKAEEYETEITKIYERIFSTSKYDIYSNIYNRIKLLKFKSEMNYRLLRAIAAKNKIIYSVKYDHESFYQSGLKNFIECLKENKKDNEPNISERLKAEEKELSDEFNKDNESSIKKARKYKNIKRQKEEIIISLDKNEMIWRKKKRALEEKIKNWEEDKDKINFLVRDSLFNLNEILKFIQIYGETFLLTNLFVADTYDKAICWLQLKQWTADEGISNDESNILLNRLIGERCYKEFQECWNWANAKRFYYKAEETHNEGRTYKDMINRGCFLNDEFSDQRLHFITAQERQKVNDPNFKKEVRGIKNNKAEKYYDSFIESNK